MMRKFSVCGASIAVFALFCSGVWAAELNNYSAEVETTTGNVTVASKVYFKDGKQRREHSTGDKSVTIFRPDKKLRWVLMPDKKVYMEMKGGMGQAEAPGQMNDPGEKMEKEFLGNETVEGHPTRKYHVEVVRNGKKEKAGYIWEATDLDNVSVKYQDENKTTTTVLRDVKIGGISDSLFEVPAGFKKLTRPMSMDDSNKIPRK